MRRPSAALVAAASAAVLVVPLVSSASAAPRPRPTYTPYATGLSVAEPSIGYDLKANAAIYGAGRKNERMTWDDRVRPANVTVVDATAPTSVTPLDAITFTDQLDSEQAPISCETNVRDVARDGWDRHRAGAAR